MHENLDLLDPETRRSLLHIYQGFSKHEGFPKNFCGEVSRKLKKDLDLFWHVGAFLLDKPRESDEPEDIGRVLISWGHSFSEDTRGNFIDLTAVQFNPWLDKPLSEGILVIPRGSEKFKRYVKDEYGYQTEPDKILPYFDPSPSLTNLVIARASLRRLS